MGIRADVNKDLKKLKHDIDIFTNRSKQLHKVILNENMFYSMNNKEVYAHIRALRLQLEISTDFLNDRWQLADDIIAGWERLHACVEADDDLRNDWHSFMCVMKLKG